MARRGLQEYQWLELARQRILEVLEVEGACVRAELQARVGEIGNAAGRHIDPHHVTTALRGLLHDELVLESPPSKTRGGRDLAVLHLPITSGNKRRIERAAGRKRLLHARFLSWSTARRGFPHGLIGTAGERMLHASIQEPSVAGRYALLYPNGAEVTHVLNAPVPAGPLDHAAWLATAPGGIPGPPVLVLFEVKNVREWIYPGSSLLHQLLYKAAKIQEANPAVRMLPVLVCRRRHFTTLSLGKELGFYAMELKEQFLHPAADVTLEHVAEVQTELGFHDLTVRASASETMVNILRRALPEHAASIARDWTDTGSPWVDMYDELRDPSLSDGSRTELMREFRTIVHDAQGDSFRGGW